VSDLAAGSLCDFSQRRVLGAFPRLFPLSIGEEVRRERIMGMLVVRIAPDELL
jgi:hypothetical protein